MRWRRVLLIVALLCAVSLVISFLTLDRWLYVALDPGPFEPSAAPAAPNYAEPSAWAALPTLDDDADVSLPELPALGPGVAKADVFYVHPTTIVGTQWNMPIDDPAVVKATARGATLIQASAFNACCAVYAPRYRQASGKAFVHPSPDGDRAIDLAYGDVAAAFASFLERRGEGRPFILASHSQGTVLAARLLREKIWGKPIGKHLVVAYLIGGPISRQTIGEDIPVCASEEQGGCVVGWNARGPHYERNDLEFKDAPSATRICVNPLTWKTDGAAAPASQNQGAVFFDAEPPAVLPAFADAACREDGNMWISQLDRMPARDFASGLLLWTMGPENYHPIEYQLYYVNLRKNAVRRVEAFQAAHASP
ncbi:DUF3089 domain-containing protein [Polyangium jinanense]|uniref:DUF3089 domain-containing protein n=1 Tax=Polyangium jinanense TaxID=2829994 RepID=A0A9X3X545_9BACT|nr:DUF3089 domain-containing protein [Polyangium jinanense]MDC3962785.1 DUF3089 domain-containing protein [Polyangium jinanense]MDC3983894.1 DUF3089 domain-containing protein [Polyangium jinanense]